MAGPQITCKACCSTSAESSISDTRASNGHLHGLGLLPAVLQQSVLASQGRTLSQVGAELGHPLCLPALLANTEPAQLPDKAHSLEPAPQQAGAPLADATHLECLQSGSCCLGGLLSPGGVHVAGRPPN